MKRILTILIAGLLTMSCDDIDCTLYNIVECKLAFYDADNNALQLNDTLDVYAEGIESPLLNKLKGKSNFAVPLSYFKDKDTLQLIIHGDGYLYEDWLIIEKTNIEHFESLNCPVKMFHTITGVSTSSNSIIDSVSITNPNVEYNNGENIKIYLHTGR